MCGPSPAAALAMFSGRGGLGPARPCSGCSAPSNRRSVPPTWAGRSGTPARARIPAAPEARARPRFRLPRRGSRCRAVRPGSGCAATMRRWLRVPVDPGDEAAVDLDADRWAAGCRAMIEAWPVPKSSRSMLQPRRFSASTFSVTMSSRSSQTRRFENLDAEPVAGDVLTGRVPSAMRSSRVGSRSSTPEKFTPIRGTSRPARSSSFSAATASRQIMTSPSRSRGRAASMPVRNSAGGITPRSGCAQRASASTPLIPPV